MLDDVWIRWQNVCVMLQSCAREYHLCTAQLVVYTQFQQILILATLCCLRVSGLHVRHVTKRTEFGLICFIAQNKYFLFKYKIKYNV